MAITATLAKMKNYFETWHTKEYDRLHIRYDDSEIRGLIEDIKSKLPTDRFGNIMQIYSKTDVDGLITSISNQVTSIRNSLDGYYNKTYIDNTVNNINTQLNKKLDKDGTNIEWKNIKDEQTVPDGWGDGTITIHVNEAIRMGHVNFVMIFDSAVKGKRYTWNYMRLPPKYRPTGKRFGSCWIEPSSNAGGGAGDVGVLFVDADGKLGGSFGMGWSNGDARTVMGTVYWRY